MERFCTVRFYGSGEYESADVSAEGTELRHFNAVCNLCGVLGRSIVIFFLILIRSLNNYQLNCLYICIYAYIYIKFCRI